MHSVLVLLVFIFIQTNSIEIVWDNNVPFNDDYELGKGDQVRMPNWFFIYPGTNWCGVGNVAENYDDLGTFSDTDACCRTHDHCDDIIEGYQQKYNLSNSEFYTRLHCKCDEEFRKCLKAVDGKVSTQVGHIYFTALGTKCFRNDYPVVRCVKHKYIPRKKCVEYKYDTARTPRYQWFDVPNY